MTKRLNFAFLFAFCLLLPALAFAQGSQGNNGNTPTLQPQQAPLLAPPGTTAGTPITNEMANEYFQKCSANPIQLQGLTPIARQMICSCTARAMQLYTTVEDVRNMTQLQTEKGRAAMSRMLEKVYFPCTLPALQDKIRNECLERAGNSPYSAQAPQMCTCVTGKVMNYAEKVGVAETLDTLNRTSTLVDPFDAFMNSPNFQQEIMRSYTDCFARTMQCQQ